MAQGHSAPINPGAATTAAAGIVELADTAETQAGLDGTKAVTPLAAAATYLPLTGGNITVALTILGLAVATESYVNAQVATFDPLQVVLQGRVFS
jgi:hypothetical protein